MRLAMKHRRQYDLITWILFLLIPGTVPGQTVIQALPRLMVSAHGEILVAQSPTDRWILSDSPGYRFEGQYRVLYNKPFMAGVYFSEASLGHYAIRYTQQDTDIKEKTSTRRFEYGLTAGFYPEINWLLQPYVQGRFGIALWKTSTFLTDRDSGESIDRYKEASHHVPGYGVDLGIHIVPNIWYIRGDVRVGLVANPSVTYLALNESKVDMVDYPIEAFEEHRSSGKWLKISLGVSLLF